MMKFTVKHTDVQKEKPAWPPAAIAGGGGGGAAGRVAALLRFGTAPRGTSAQHLLPSRVRAIGGECGESGARRKTINASPAPAAVAAPASLLLL
jgi:hypothetical protein